MPVVTLAGDRAREVVDDRDLALADRLEHHQPADQHPEHARQTGDSPADRASSWSARGTTAFLEGLHLDGPDLVAVDGVADRGDHDQQRQDGENDPSHCCSPFGGRPVTDRFIEDAVSLLPETGTVSLEGSSSTLIASNFSASVGGSIGPVLRRVRFRCRAQTGRGRICVVLGISIVLLSLLHFSAADGTSSWATTAVLALLAYALPITVRVCLVPQLFFSFRSIMFSHSIHGTSTRQLALGFVPYILLRASSVVRPTRTVATVMSPSTSRRT